MKRKFIVFALMCALVVGVVPLHHATTAYAATETTIANDGAFAGWCSDNGLPSEIALQLNDAELNRNINYIVFLEPENNNCYTVLRFTCISDVCKPYFSGEKFYINDSSSTYCYSWARTNSSEWGTCFSTQTFTSYPVVYNSMYSIHDKQIVFSTVDIYADSSCTELLYESSLKEGYSFYKWCADAGLNCHESSYESDMVLPYVFNDYVHVVRRTSTDKYGRWVLTTIGNSIIGDNLADYTLMVDDTGELQVFALYSGEEEKGYQLFIRNYIYDTDGWKMISFELFDTREDDDFIIELGEDSAINDVNLLAYTSVDIYDDGLNLKHPASTEYYDVNDILPDVPEEPEEPEEPSVTPTVAPLPTVVPPITAGQATVTKNRTAIYEEPSSTSQVQHYLFEGGVVYVVEEHGEDWYYVRYDMGGLSYTGYVAQDNVNYDVDNGFASEDVIDGYEGQVDDLLGMVGNVPKMIYALFSFLPPWCLALVGVSFSAMLALIGWKILRG